MGEGAEFELAEPNASATLESLRSVGYSTEAAVADLIDNSISAQARNVFVDFVWLGRDSYVRIADDGHGMLEGELRDAMRPSSKSPLDARSERDLGRFGMGLKTASLSQARRLSVTSKRSGGSPATRCWDLDYVAQGTGWRLLKSLPPESTQRTAWSGTGPGTVVLWEKLDRLVGDAAIDDPVQHGRFLETVATVEHHLAMVFQRFIQGQSLRIHVQGNPIAPWDPFLERESATQALPVEEVRLDGAIVRLYPFVLPHHDRLSPDAFKAGGGQRGWTPMQGFYVYRSKRLVIAADWLATGYQSEVHYQLARIRVDIDNQHDQLWQLDVRKANARPPAQLRSEFKRVARIARERAAEVYRHRGKVIARRTSQPFAFVWKQRIRNGNISYEIERDHPLVQAVLRQVQGHSEQVRALLTLIEETVPTPLVAMDSVEKPTAIAPPFGNRSSAEANQVLHVIYEALRADGLSRSAAIERLAVMEPFQHFPDLVAALVEETRIA